MSSPQARGCFSTRRRNMADNLVFPAGAGVFLDFHVAPLVTV